MTSRRGTRPPTQAELDTLPREVREAYARHRPAAEAYLAEMEARRAQRDAEIEKITIPRLREVARRA